MHSLRSYILSAVLIFEIGFSELTGFIGFSGRGKMGYKEEFLAKEQ